MLFIIDMTAGGHRWEKQNLVGLVKKGRGVYDRYKCAYCGIVGEMWSLSKIQIKRSYDESHVRRCPDAPHVIPPLKVQITECHAQSPQFANLKPGSIHYTCQPPAGYRHDYDGVWVMGVSEPVKVLINEFIPAKPLRRRRWKK